jgi:hypothetical protein
VGVLFAIKNAIYEARKETGNEDWFQLGKEIYFFNRKEAYSVDK